MTTQTQRAGYFMNNGHTNPTTTIRKSFVTGPAVEPVAVVRIRSYDEKMDEVYAGARRGQAPGRCCAR